MEYKEILKRVTTVISAIEFYDAPVKITESTTWKELEMDSLSALDAVLGLEYEFNLQIPDCDVDKLFEGTVGDGCKLLQELMKPFE